MDNIDGNVIGEFLLFMIALVFSLSVHESAHAWMSNQFGDDLARLQGRISLNPAVHVDPIGTLLFPAIAFFTGMPLIGWAKPTPVNPLRWRDKRVANFWVSIAGVLGNLLIVIVVGITIRVLFETGVIGIDFGARSWMPIAPISSSDAFARGAVNLLSVM